MRPREAGESDGRMAAAPASHMRQSAILFGGEWRRLKLADVRGNTADNGGHYAWLKKLLPKPALPLYGIGGRSPARRQPPVAAYCDRRN